MPKLVKNCKSCDNWSMKRGRRLLTKVPKNPDDVLFRQCNASAIVGIKNKEQPDVIRVFVQGTNRRNPLKTHAKFRCMFWEKRAEDRS